jgi:hypothetical protein
MLDLPSLGMIPYSALFDTVLLDEQNVSFIDELSPNKARPGRNVGSGLNETLLVLTSPSPGTPKVELKHLDQ